MSGLVLPPCSDKARPLEAPSEPAKPRIAAKWKEDVSWGRDLGRYIGDGFLPDFVEEKLRGKELIEQLFVLKRCMSEKIRYEKGKVTVLRDKARGMTLGLSRLCELPFGPALDRKEPTSRLLVPFLGLESRAERWRGDRLKEDLGPRLGLV